MNRCSKKSSRLNREPWTEPKHKNEMYRRWKQGEATHKKYGNITWVTCKREISCPASKMVRKRIWETAG